ncbi:MAG: VCBS repeat-containing protein [Acidobacteriota bacterium]
MKRSALHYFSVLSLLLVFAPTAASVAASAPLFVEVDAGAGFRFVHENGMTGQYYFHEMMGPGVALLDYDNDGDLDVYLVQGHALDDPSAPRPSDVLLRNDLSKGELRFTDVTREAGVDVARGYGMGIATADVDNDGWVDLPRTYYLLDTVRCGLWHPISSRPSENLLSS